MPTADQARIDRDRARPRITELWWAMRPLTSVLRFMQTGAHPDDEISGMLAALVFRDGVNISYACSTRGEGGQNDIGRESGAALGALRTAEMERACDVLKMRMYWHSETPEDPISDFGFSKSGAETLEHWGYDRTLARFVEIVREERPDIICPTFLDVPGQHGHHRAMTQAAQDVMSAAADPAFPSNRPPWQVKKLYLPAWSGAGQAYDDDEPPPPATITISGDGHDPISGWSWERIGQQSRGYHRTQGMGRWVDNSAYRDWPLHLAQSLVEGPDLSVGSGLPANLADLAYLNGAGTIAADLTLAQGAIEKAFSVFPNFPRVSEYLAEALAAIRRAIEECPAVARVDILHRLEAKEDQLGQALRLALGVDIDCRIADTFLVPGQATSLDVETNKGRAEDVTFSFDLPDGWSVGRGWLKVGAAAVPSQPYRFSYDPFAAQTPACVVNFVTKGVTAKVRIPLDPQPVVLPKCAVSLGTTSALINLSGPDRSFECSVGAVHPEGAEVKFFAPNGWHVVSGASGVRCAAPDHVAAGRYEISAKVDGSQAMLVQRIVHQHTAPTAIATPAVINVLAVNAVLPEVRVGYVGAGNDRVIHWLRELGADVTDLTNEELASDEALAGFDTIVIGIFAMRFRAGLCEALARLHRWVHAGGTLVTLYHRPWDNWDPDKSPPYRLEIGQPSLRWRVTDQAADVRHLVDHPILLGPNRIEASDWSGWVKERGLYFAKSWDQKYVPLIELADPGEDPHQGALLAADVGAGRHIHTSLILHHQMENLVPGAFRIMANLLSKRV